MSEEQEQHEEQAIEQVEEKVEITIQPADAILVDDNENFVSNYIEPDASCLCCNVPGISIRINKAYLDGMSYRDIVEKFNGELTEKVNKKLDLKTLSTHFTKHFNHKGVAVAEYNRRYGLSKLAPAEQKGMQNIFSALVGKRINDLELLDFSMKEQIKRLKELEDMKADRIRENRTYNLDQIIMKQESVVNNIQTQIMNKLKIWQKAQVQSKQIEMMDRQLEFLDHKTASFLGLSKGPISLDPFLAREAEKLYLRTVIEGLIKRVKGAADSTTLDTAQKSSFFKEFNRQCKGIEKEIDDAFQDRLKNLKSVHETKQKEDKDSDSDDD